MPYDIILVIGQSNAVGRGIGIAGVINEANRIYLANAPRIFQLGRFGTANMQIIPANEPLQHWGQNPATSDKRMKGSALPFALRYVSTITDPSRNVLIIPAAMGSTSILQWDNIVQNFGSLPARSSLFNQDQIDPDSETGTAVPRVDSTVLIDDAIMRLNYCMGLDPANRFVFALWDQGETDVLVIGNTNNQVHNLLTPAVYRNKLRWIISRVRYSWGPVPIVVVGMSRLWSPVNGRPSGAQARLAIIEAQKTVVNSDLYKRSAYIDPIDFTPADFNPGLLHFSAQGIRTIGIRAFDAYRQIIQGFTGDSSKITGDTSKVTGDAS